MKRVSLMVAAVAIATLSTACGGTSGSATGSTDTPTNGSSTAPPPSTAAVVTPSSTAPTVSAVPPGGKHYQATQTSSDGYKQTMNLTLYPAIPGRDLAVLNAAWSAVGGTGDVPCEDAAGLDMYTGISIPTQTSVYAVGTLSIINETASFGGGDMMWDFAGPDTNGYAMGFGYSNGPECDSLSSGTLTKPHWTSSTWGPVPIVVAYGNVVNPNHPDGDYAKIAQAPFALPLANAPITSDGAPVTGIVVTPADPAWLQQAQGQK